LRIAAISEEDTESQDYVLPTRWQRILSMLGDITQTLLPSLHHFKHQSILAQIASIFAVPAVMALTLTLPVVVTRYESATAAREKLFNGDGRLVEFEEEGEERVLIAEEEVLEDMHGMSFNKWLTSVQCAIAPVFCAAVLFSSYFTFILVNPIISNMYTYRWH
jgi:solute carrier family 24 (sodium/potassium/calcium exchanger), member 6